MHYYFGILEYWTGGGFLLLNPSSSLVNMILVHDAGFESLLKCALLCSYAEHTLLYEKDFSPDLKNYIFTAEYDLKDLIIKFETLYKNRPFLHDKEKLIMLSKFVSRARFHKRKDRFNTIIDVLKQALDSGVSFAVSKISSESRLIEKMSTDVKREFERFKEEFNYERKEKIIFVKKRFENNIQEIAMTYLQQLFPSFFILLSDCKKTWVGFNGETKMIDYPVDSSELVPITANVSKKLL